MNERKALAAEIVARLEAKSDHMYQWPRWAAADEAAEAVLASAWLAARDEGVRAAERERLAAAWEEVDGPDRVRRPPFRPFHWTPTIDIDEE